MKGAAKQASPGTGRALYQVDFTKSTIFLAQKIILSLFIPMKVYYINQLT